MTEVYEIQYADEAATDVRSLRAFDRTKVLDPIELHLTAQPKAVSRSRIKAMEQSFWSQYRLRVDEFRVYYDVHDEKGTVFVLRVLEKGTGATPETST